ncbi:MAG: DMT family transporter [Ectothiorhodospiraceae bacterium]|nr:DMT family transporter [Ectothiorhodospiraceae bacterium]
MSDIQRQEALACGALVFTTLFWAGNAVVARGIVDTIPPMALSFWRWLLAFFILLPFAWPHLRAAMPTIRAHWRSLFVLALLSAGLFNSLLYLSAHTTTAINISLVNSTMPVMIGLMAFLLLGERLSRRQMSGIVLALIGMLVIVSRGSLGILLSVDIALGDLLMIVAVACWGLYSVLMKKRGIRLHPVVFLTAIIAMALPVVLVFHLVELALGYRFSPGMELAAPLLYVAIFPSLLSYMGWNYGVAVLGPSRSAMFIYLLPLFGAVLSILFLGEGLYAYHAAGGLLILVGLYLATRVRQTPAMRMARERRKP